MSKEFDAIEFLMELDRMAEGCETEEEIHKLCDEEHCHCEEHGIFRSSITHTLQIFVYILIISFILNLIILLH